MRHITLGQSGIRTCAAPLGAMYFGTKQDRAASFALLDHYVALGGDFIDTANIYAHWVGDAWCGGESETILGDWLKARGNRNNVTIATKVGIAYGEVPTSLAAPRIIEECEKSLKRLGIETIDLYFAHRDDPSVPQEEVLGAFARLIEQGKVRAIGASNFTIDRLAAAHEIVRLSGLPRYDVLQQRYTYLPLRRGAYKGPQVVLSPDMSAYCIRAEVSVMAYSVALGGAYNRYPNTDLPEEYRMETNRTRMAVLGEVARELGVPPQQVVLAWVWGQQGHMPLVAGSSAAQFDENFAAMDLVLSPEQIARLDDAGQ